MLFMGEEWGSSSPFQFFTSHPEPELAGATAEGRKREFAEHGWDADEIPDPQDPQTFQRSKLTGTRSTTATTPGSGGSTAADRAAAHRTRPGRPLAGPHAVDYDEDQRWIVMHRGSLAIACNLGADPVDVPVTGEVVLAWGEPTPSSQRETIDALRRSIAFAILRAVLD